LARLRSARQTEKPLAAEMLRDRVKLEDDLSQHQRRYAELQKHAERLNSHRQDLKDRLVEKDQRLDGERRECSGLRAQLVQSPDRMKRELSNKENSLEEESKFTQALETQGRSLTEKVDKIKKVQNDLAQVMGTLNQCEEQLDKTRVAQKDSRELQKRVQEQRNKLREIEMNMTVNEKQLHYAQQRFESSEEHGRSRVEDSQKELRRAMEGKAKAEQEVFEAEKRCNSIEDETRRIQLNAAELLRACHDEKIAVSKKLASLEQSVLEYSHNITSAIAAK